MLGKIEVHIKTHQPRKRFELGLRKDYTAHRIAYVRERKVRKQPLFSNVLVRSDFVISSPIEINTTRQRDVIPNSGPADFSVCR